MDSSLPGCTVKQIPSDNGNGKVRAAKTTTATNWTRRRILNNCKYRLFGGRESVIQITPGV